ncbi:ABC transporter permease [Nocardioides psychrotolerans]|uniref:Osmoprotectant transport system permease protein n=1 Tax=Nocardioides psychrotolerans TaxID=1005945 RepID=A0A1I3HKS3_9ACTN|nr:ABC transporter permease [Nocardioides psychrotolerans]GEP40006.1 ABC transporter permease [Nocardioides psychrotolerans]SFI36100.1 osmoprotectant transport system permease protein [Nocardioides psychrotolerans]
MANSVPMALDGLGTFLDRRSDDLVQMTTEHLIVVALSVGIATVLGVGIGLLVWDRNIGRSVAITTAAIILTIPSLALLAILSPLFGLGWGPTVVALVMYSLLPIIRNTVVGLREVPAPVLESARGMGMKPSTVLIRIQLPMAWPIILTGIRVATQLAIGIAAIGAYVAGPGLGQFIFRGLSSLGSKNALNYALSGTVGVVVLALVADAVFILITRYTTPRGLRA